MVWHCIILHNILVKSCDYVQVVRVGDHVAVTPEEEDQPLYIARVSSMWEETGGDKLFHATWFHRGSDTILGETSDPCELFAADLCDDSPLGAIIDKVTVS